MPDVKSTLKCRFCTYQVWRFHTLRNGQVKHGYATLVNHVENAHKAEYEAIIDQVMAEHDSAPDTLDGAEEVSLNG